MITDPAFASVQSTVFARNLQQFDSQAEPLGEAVGDLISRKIDSIENFKCQWLKISMRRNALSCIENSLLATRLQKPTMLSINFISMQGYDLSAVKSSPCNFIVKEQKKAAL